MKDFPFGTFGPEHLKRIKEGIHCFNEKKYWECHEVLEDIWLEDRNDPARNVYWAIIQVANSMYHVRDKNIEGAEGQLNKAKEKFLICEEKSIRTNLMDRFLSWEKFKNLVFKVPDNNSNLSNYQELYNFTFENYIY